jgi:cell division protein FtsB
MGDSRRVLLERRGLAVVGGLLLAGWLAFILVGALGQATEAERVAERLRAENAELERLVEAARAEVELIQTDLFLRLQARAYGLGEPGEQPFRLADGAPPPEPLPLLGEEDAPSSATTPLEAWLDLLFGA